MIQLKSKSILNATVRENNFVVLDIETTGLSVDNDYIIELAAVRIRDGQIKEEFVSLMKPGKRIPYFITTLTGINNKMVEKAPIIQNVLNEFLEWLEPEDLLIAHNASFDRRFILHNLERHLEHVLKNDWADTLALSKAVVTETDNHKLDTLLAYFNINIAVKERHRAMGDAKAEAILLHHLCKRVDESVVLLDK